MMKLEIDTVWRDSLNAADQYHVQLNRLLTEFRAELPVLLRTVLFQRRDMPLALTVVEKLSVEERKSLFPELVQLATKTVPHTGTARALISALPRDWVTKAIIPLGEKVLVNGDEEECRRLLELYSVLDKDLLRSTCQRLLKTGRSDLEKLVSDFT